MGFEWSFFDGLGKPPNELHDTEKIEFSKNKKVAVFSETSASPC